MPHANTETMNAHLAEISRHVAPAAHAPLLLDGWHNSTSPVGPDNITLMPPPTYSPELHPVENLWQHLRRNTLANRGFSSSDAIVEASCAAWNSLIAMPQRLASPRLASPRLASITLRECAKVNG